MLVMQPQALLSLWQVHAVIQSLVAVAVVQLVLQVEH